MIGESAPLSVKGSFTKSLLQSKMWMCLQLKQMMQDLGIQRFNQVYSLGSWYGNMALMMLRTHVPFEQMIDVDIERRYLETSRLFLKDLVKQRRLRSICGDCNHLVYHCTQPALVINNSTNNMHNHGWLDHIPNGTLVALQGRDNEPQNKLNKAKTLQEFNELYPLGKTLLLSSLKLQDPGDQYRRFMKIGIK